MAAHYYETLYNAVIVYGLNSAAFWLPVYYQEFQTFGATEIYPLNDLAVRVDFPSPILGIQFRD